MNEKPIRKNTIVSTTDKRLTLLEWLKQVQKQLKDLSDNGVKAVVEEFDTAEAFYNAYATKPAGTPVLAIVADDAAIMGTLSEITDKLLLKGTIYQGGKMYTSAEADTLSIVGGGELATASELTTAISSVWKPYAFVSAQDFISAMASGKFKNGDPVYISWPTKVGLYNYYNIAIGIVNFAFTDSITIDGYCIYYEHRTDAINDYKFMINPELYGYSGRILVRKQSIATDVITKSSFEGHGLFNDEDTFEPSKLYVLDRYNGVSRFMESPNLSIVGSRAANLTDFLGIIVDATNKEIYYGLNGYMKVSNAGVVENAISGTQLKEAVQRATQKTYWHSVKIKGTNGIFTFNAPSTFNTPVVSTEKLLELFNNNTWAGFGKLETDMLFAIRLANDNIEFVKADDTKVSIGTFGTLDISDDVKEVK